MSKETAIRITNAEIGAKQYQADAAKDRAPLNVKTPSVLDIIREARDRMTEAELLQLARSAARLELRGFDPEDRADCASDIVGAILFDSATEDPTDRGIPPLRSSPKARLTYACGLARNWRRSKQRDQAHTVKVQQAEEDRYAQSPDAMLDVIDEYSPAYLAASAGQNAEAAHRVAAHTVDRLDLPKGGAVYALVYQWARDATGKVCAAENSVKLDAWQQRVKRGAAMLRALYPATELLGFLTEGSPVIHAGILRYALEDASKPAGKTTPGGNQWRERLQRPREGTANGARPEPPTSAEDARAACLMRHQCPTPGLAAIGQARLHRGYIERSIAGRFTWNVPGRTSDQVKADALRAIARDYARTASREPNVNPPA